MDLNRTMYFGEKEGIPPTVKMLNRLTTRFPHRHQQKIPHLHPPPHTY